MNGLMMDYQLTLPTLLRRAEPYYGAKEIVTRLPDRSFHRTTYAETCRRARALAVGARRPRPAARRPRRDALLEPLPAPRGVPRHPVRRLRAAHAEPAAASERPRVHRDARGRPRGDRRPEPAAAAASSSSTARRSSTSSSSRTRTRSCSPAADADALARPGAGRERGCGDVLHERDDRAAERRPLLAPLDDAAHARRRRRQPDGARHLRVRLDPAGRADVPRERVGLSVPRDDDRREARLPGTVPRPGEPARRVRGGGGDVDRGRAHDLARHPRAARREPRQVGPLADEGDARRRIRRAALDDRRLQAAARAERRARLGDDRDLARRVDRAVARRARRGGRGDAVRLHRDAGACRCRSSSCATATSKATSSRGTASRWASSRSAVRGWRPATTTRRSRQSAGPRTAGSRPATSSRCILAASSRSRTGRRT